jgi:antitoxin component YwqK of YwqJK toxin-antitoxin module
MTTTSGTYKYYPALSGFNKIFTTIAFVLLLYNNSNGQTLITDNKELNMKSQTENAELLKKSLEESLAADLKEANEFKDRMEKIMASDLQEAYLIRDSLRQGIKPDIFRRSSTKIFYLQKEGKNIRLKLDSGKKIKYEETNMSHDRLKDFARIGLNSDGEIAGYSKHEQNKTTVISFWHGFTKEETDESSSIKRRSLFYPNGKLSSTEEISDGICVNTRYIYDEDGVLTEISEFDYDDSLYEFTREDVMEYIKKENLDHNGTGRVNIKKYPRCTVNGEIKIEVLWHIHIFAGGWAITIVLNGKTGEKLSYRAALPK